METVGEKIKTYRKSLYLSQKELAIKSGVERSQISKIEAGKKNGFQYATIEKLLKALGYSVNFEPNNIYLHPFVKWAGGKTQLLEKLSEFSPKSFNKYYEPFVGGGAFLLRIKPKDFVINDTNKELISVYKCFVNDKYYKELTALLERYENIHSEKTYYDVRSLDRDKRFDNLSIPEISARMIYLNKSCFNGLYRVNSNGYFNVPFGKKMKINCYDRNNFENLKSYFKNSKSNILNGDYKVAIRDAAKGDFVYFDPPYDTWEDKVSFTSYNKDNFGKKEQKELAECFKELDSKGVYVMLSNHNTKYIQELYKGFNIHIVPAKRMINAKGSGRGAVEEVIITNY